MNKPAFYEIRVEGYLDSAWSNWFDGLAIRHEESGAGGQVCTVFAGRLVDQTALHGVLMRIRDLGLPLIALQRISVEQLLEEEIEP